MKQVIEYKGMKIVIKHDPSATEPHKDGDYMPPMAIKAGRNYGNAEYLDALEDIRPTDGQYKRHKKALIAAMVNAGRMHMDDVEQRSAIDTRYAFDDAMYYAHKEYDLDALEAVAEILGFPCLNTCSHGYSQGDYADILVVYTPAYLQNVGLKAKKVTEGMMQGDVDTWSAWAWGDVYGYYVEDKDGDFVDSCAGFYGSDHEKNGLLQYAKDAIDAHLAQADKQRTDRLKQMIRARAPLTERMAFAAR